MRRPLRSARGNAWWFKACNDAARRYPLPWAAGNTTTHEPQTPRVCARRKVPQSLWRTRLSATLLIWPGAAANPSQIMQKLKGRTARFILKTLKENRELIWCRRMRQRLQLPETVHDEAHYQVWQRGSYDMNIWSDKKRLEKLNYMHHNPARRRLVKTPGNWPRSSWRYYCLGDDSLLAMDRVP